MARVHVESWRTTYAGLLPEEVLRARLSTESRETLWKRVLADASQFSFVAVDGAEVVGFSNGGKNRGAEAEYAGELYSMYLLEAYQRRGLGRALAEALAGRLLASGMNSMVAWVLANNPSRGFYEALGGKLVGSKPFVLEGATFEEVGYGWLDLRRMAATRGP